MGWKAFIREDVLGRGKQLFIARSYGGREDGSVMDVLMPPDAGHTLQRVLPGQMGPDAPFLDVGMADGVIQAVLDAAWASGMRPTGISGEKGEIQRLEGHLADMRAIAFHTTKAPKPER